MMFDFYIWRHYVKKLKINKRQIALTVSVFCISLITLWLLVSNPILLNIRPTRTVAELYLTAIITGDRERALGLIREEALCSGAGMYERIDEHLALFSATQVRNIEITVEDIGGSVAYSPGTEAADIRFEYRRADSSAWHSAEIGSATVSYRGTLSRYRAICWLWK